ncbi:MAG: YiiX/YebB-like N1pC/P60 family cysteine hydrolase [Ginsengibacter sp.]
MSCHIQRENGNDSGTINSDSAITDKNANFAFIHIHNAQIAVQPGDLVLRSGRDYTSEVMRKLSRHDKTYSHCGIASIENDSVFVYHSIGGEWNPDQKLRRDLFAVFCNPYENRGFGIYRYSLNKKQKAKVLQNVHQFYKDKVMFDMQFNLDTDDRMYCSEFVYKAIKPVHDLKTTTINHITFVAIDNLFLDAACHEIKRVKFEGN